jgi:glycosyltransferase involved in cell wall biosynthesis
MRNLLAIITPAKNESANIPELVRSVACQTVKPDCWIFVNDDSSDSTEEVFNAEVKKYPELLGVCYVDVFKHFCADNSYALGEKYSRVVRFGFDQLIHVEKKRKVTYAYLGILDADVFPEPSYYEMLLGKMSTDEKLGIAAGGTQTETGKNERRFRTISARSHAPGGLRVYKRACFDDAGYVISVSQDSVSEARAIMNGWKVRSFPDVRVTMRKRGGKSNFCYYGRSEYLRWSPFWYICMKAGKLWIRGHGKDASDYLKGYREAWKSKIPRMQDPVVKKYYRYRIFYKLAGM